MPCGPACLPMGCCEPCSSGFHRSQSVSGAAAYSSASASASDLPDASFATSLAGTSSQQGGGPLPARAKAVAVCSLTCCALSQLLHADARVLLQGLPRADSRLRVAVTLKGTGGLSAGNRNLQVQAVDEGMTRRLKALADNIWVAVST